MISTMRTTLDIDAALLDEAVRWLQTRTTRETMEMVRRAVTVATKP
jgi:Arc/MetJ family transcription regulator